MSSEVWSLNQIIPTHKSIFDLLDSQAKNGKQLNIFLKILSTRGVWKKSMKKSTSFMLHSFSESNWTGSGQDQSTEIANVL